MTDGQTKCFVNAASIIHLLTIMIEILALVYIYILYTHRELLLVKFSRSISKFCRSVLRTGPPSSRLTTPTETSGSPKTCGWWSIPRGSKFTRGAQWPLYSPILMRSEFSRCGFRKTGDGYGFCVRNSTLIANVLAYTLDKQSLIFSPEIT